MSSGTFIDIKNYADCMQRACTLRRLAAEHADLHDALPVNYLFPRDDSDDLTQLVILLAGPNGTPYSQGLWRLKLSIPVNYPASPPRAAFMTRIWHPNVEENTGSVCVDTLKKDWEPSLTLRHVLLVISCLLINPNPDSALNSTAGHLLQEDFEGFAQQARLMTSIHARIPLDLQDQVKKAKLRGETIQRMIVMDNVEQPKSNKKGASALMVIMKNAKRLTPLATEASIRPAAAPLEHAGGHEECEILYHSAEDSKPEGKENGPSLSSSVVMPIRRSGLAKRPLSELPIPTEADAMSVRDSSLSPSEQNIAANCAKITLSSHPIHPAPRGSQALMEGSQYLNRCSLEQQEGFPLAKRICLEEVKENIDTNLFLYKDKQTSDSDLPSSVPYKVPIQNTTCVTSTAQKANLPRARIGLRRL